MARQFFFLLATVLTIFVLTLNASAQTQYTITDLGANAQANSINNAGQIVGASPTTAPINGQLYNHAVLWNESGNMTEIGLLPFGSISSATAINDAGQVSGYSDVCREDGQSFNFSYYHAFMWDPTTGLHESQVQNFFYGGENMSSRFTDTMGFGINSHEVVGQASGGTVGAVPFGEYFSSTNNYCSLAILP
jgi:probable HAF family extracellular repeat protein